MRMDIEECMRMPILADHIELFIKSLLELDDEISLQRNELAQHFSCAPSQINYVLATRFTLERGYTIISRRGGGGYIRVKKVDMDGNALLHEIACRELVDAISERDAAGLIARLLAEALVTPREANLMLAATSGYALPTKQLQDAARAKALKNMLTTLIQYDCNFAATQEE